MHTLKLMRLSLRAALSVFVLCVMFATASAQQGFVKNGNATTYKGNKFVYSKETYDTVTENDKVTGEELIKIRAWDPKPILMNNKKIYSQREVTTAPYPRNSNDSLEPYILKGIRNYFKPLDNGTYRIHLTDVIIDENGKVAFYHLGSLNSRDANGKSTRLQPVFYKAFDAKIDKLLSDAPLQEPGSVAGKKVISIADVYLYQYVIKVNNHEVTYTAK